MSPSDLICRIFLAIVFPPVSILGIHRVGCGTFLLLLLLTMAGYLPGMIAALVIIINEYDKTSKRN